MQTVYIIQMPSGHYFKKIHKLRNGNYQLIDGALLNEARSYLCRGHAQNMIDQISRQFPVHPVIRAMQLSIVD